MVFNNIDALKEFISIDKGMKDISPIRFINVETMDMWVKVKSFLTQISSEFMKLSEYCELEDNTPNLYRLKSDLKKITANTLVTPLSEHLRVHNTYASKTFYDILKMDFENNKDNDLKVYIPVYRMKSLLQNITLDSRNKKSILFLETLSDCDYSLTIIQNNLNISLNANEIHGYQKYLLYWEQNPDKPIVLYTQNAIYYADVVFSDDVKVIVNAYGLIKYHYCSSDDIKENWGNNEQWGKLVSQFGNLRKIDDVIRNILLIPKFDKKLFEDWSNKDSFTKWLIWLWAKLKSQTQYLNLVLNQCETIEDFENSICNSIIELTGNDNYLQLYNERKTLIINMNLILKTDFWNKVNMLSPIQKIKCLSNNTGKEKAEIILTIAKTDNNSELLKVLKYVYPSLAAYLTLLTFERRELTEYFQKYKNQKILNIVSEEFLKCVENIAKEQGKKIWELQSRNAIVNQQYNDDCIILFVDALGVEYLTILKEIFDTHNINFDYQIGHCNIPSTTEQNNDFFINKNNDKYYDLDKLKHSNIEYPLNVIKEFDLIENIASKAIELLSVKRKVLIVADHGTSRLAVIGKGRTIEAKPNAVKYKYGRYCIDSINDYSEYSGCINKDGYWIFANYDRFAGQGAPLGETHGGASLEEVVVPIITIQNTNSITKEQEKVKINLLTQEIRLPVNKYITVKFTLSKQLNDVVAVVNNKRYTCIFDDNCYSFNPDVGIEHTYTAKIVANEIVGTFKYKVIKGISLNFDI